MNMLIESLLTTNRVGDPMYQGNNITSHDILPIELPDEVWNLDYRPYITSRIVTPRYYIDDKARIDHEDDGYCETGVDTTLTIEIDNGCNCAGHPDPRFTQEFLWEFTFVNMDEADVLVNLALLIKKLGSLRRVLTLFCLHCK